MMRRAFSVMMTVAILAGWSEPQALADEVARQRTVEALASGLLEDGAAALAAMAEADPGNDEAAFGHGMVRFVQAIEHLSQGLYRYGLQPPAPVLLPIVRLPVPPNPQPEPLDYVKFRDLLVRYVADLAVAEEALSKVGEGEAKIPVDLAAIRYDANGDGAIGDDESLMVVMARIMGRTRSLPPAGEPLVVAFDRADAFWLRGYSHVLMAVGEFLLAHDWHESFEASFHVFFPLVNSAFQQALAPPETVRFGADVGIADLISFLHIRWPVAEPARMSAVREHFKAMIALSRENWAAAEAETDDDREWIPNPRQTAAFGVPVTAEHIAAWHQVLDTADALLDGRILLPHWRMRQGINLRKVFQEPRPFDLVLWITGPATLPYLEDGPVLTSEEWAAIVDSFDGSFGSYAIWFN